MADNIKILNKEYESYGLTFKQENNVVKILETQAYILNDYPEIKEKLMEKYGVTFSKKDGWHIKKKNTLNLKLKKIKTKPFRSFEKLIKALSNFIIKIQEEKLRKSILLLLKKYPFFFTAPASKYHHHDYKYGLLEHIIETLEHAMFYYCKYSKEILLDMDLIIAGSILHDFGKVNCFELIGEDVIRIKDISLLQGHIINGVKIISQEIDSDILDDILHVIGSHHRIKDWGSPVSPIKQEAWIIHLADDASSKIG